MIDRIRDGIFSRSAISAISGDTERSTSTRALLDVLEADYQILQGRLAKYLGSKELATEALHDAYVKLRSGPTIGTVRNRRSYLYRMAVNLARNRRRNEGRVISFGGDLFDDIQDEAPGQERIVGALLEMQRAIAALHTLSPKRREIFLAKWRDEKSQAEIAMEFGMHKRSVQKELAKAEAFVRGALTRG